MQRAKRLAEEISDAWKLQIEATTLQHFKDSPKYLDELTEYDTTTFTKCMDNMIKLMTEREVEVIVLILVKARAPFVAIASSV